MKPVFSLFFCLLFASFLRAQSIDPLYQDGVLYFQFKPDFPLASLHVNDQDAVRISDMHTMSELFEKYGVTQVLRPFHLFGNEELLRTMEVHFDRMDAVDSFVTELQRNEWVALVEKVPLMKILGNVNDPYYNTVNGRNWKWHLEMINADSAWMLQSGNPNIKVAVVDNFVWEGHPDLQIDSANLCTVSLSYAGYKYSVGSAAPPASIAQGSTEKAYYSSHGTHCMGLVGATNNNRIGIASIGSGVTLMGVSGSNAQYPQNIIYGMQGVQWAAENGADVISMSFGSAVGSTIYKTLMKTCHDAGIVLLAAAGNEGDEGNAIIYPAGLPTVISVASVDGDGKLSYFSQWGKDRADIACPGGFIVGKSQYPNILSTTFCTAYLTRNMGFSGTCYDGMQGTSMACPLAAGVVGLLLSKDSTLTPDAVKLRLQRTAHPLNPASEHIIDGYGYIDAYAALRYDYLLVSEDSLLFSVDPGFRNSLVVESSGPWQLSGLPAWLTADKVKGDSGKTVLTFTTLDSNSGAAARVAELTFTGSDRVRPQTVTVNQANYRFEMTLDKHRLLLAGKKGASDTVHVHSTVTWNLNYECTWLGSKIIKVSDDSALVVLTASSSNTWGEVRDTYLFFKVDGLPDDTLYVQQRMADFISLSSVLANVGPASGDTVSVGLYSNVHWTLSGGDSSWIISDLTEGDDSARLVFTVLQDNTTGAVRSAAFTITNGSIVKSLTIRQQHNLSLNEADPAVMQLYPNPTTGQVVCRMPGNVTAEVRVSDLQGRLLQVIAMNGGTALLDLSAYRPGMYLLRCGNATAKVVKQ